MGSCVTEMLIGSKEALEGWMVRVAVRGALDWFSAIAVTITLFVPFPLRVLSCNQVEFEGVIEMVQLPSDLIVKESLAEQLLNVILDLSS
jgi:hypothetical protein